MIKRLFHQPEGFYRSVFSLMVPLVLQSIITQSITLSDAFMVGVLDEQYLAAVTLVSTPIFVFTIFVFGVQSGAGILVAQYWGKGDKNAINRVIGVAMYFTVIITFTGAIVINLFPTKILSWVTTEMDIVELAVPYARFAGFAMALNSVSVVYVACQRSMENTRLGFKVFIVSAVLSVFGKWLFIFGNLGMPALGIMGAAMATFIARAVEVGIITVHAFRNPNLPLKIKLVLRPGFVILRDFVKYSLPVIFNETLWGIGTIVFPVILGHMAGADKLLTAYNISGNLDRLVTVAVMACANATSVIIGKEIGAGRQNRIVSAARSLSALGALIGICSGALLLIARITFLEPLIYPLFDLSAEAASNATIMLTILVFVIPLRTICYTMGIGVLRGGGDVRIYMFIDVGVLYVFSIPMASITGLVLHLSIAVVYSSVLVENLLKVPLIYLRMRSKKWIHDVTRERLE